MHVIRKYISTKSELKVTNVLKSTALCYSESPPTVGEAERSIVMNMSVYLSVCVCLSVREHISRTTHPIFTRLLLMLPMTVARFSWWRLTRYVLPVYG